ncbi:sesquipedalian-1-like [Betta splendens]|uniref:Sesquipedalian n=1 Tax=Betta splendens TaxID=158456 RepID=A0A6P7L7U8_BETSP|nr:sesquipedalian-1-like [Betta splendens]XP_028990711.1 sesquipedalian-1-like [Betta splendens]
MKIDEKVVSNYFEAGDSPVDKEGYLYKKGGINTSYQKRWCVLKGNLLFYKERRSDRDVIGAIVLEGCTVQLCESEEQFAFALVWSEPGLRAYKFAAESQACQESWLKALQGANHKYLALLLTDMEKKYRDTLRSLRMMEQAHAFNASVFSASQRQPGSLQSRMSTHSLLVVPGGAGGDLISGLTAQPAAASPQTAHKRSPKLWPKRNANAAPGFRTEWFYIQSVTMDEFTKLHEEFGKEVRELITEWSRRGQGGAGVQEENLIDFG